MHGLHPFQMIISGCLQQFAYDSGEYIKSGIKNISWLK